MEKLLDALREQDREILPLKLEGLSTDEIAQRLDCSGRTVRCALHAIYRKLIQQLELQPDDPSSD